MSGRCDGATDSKWEITKHMLPKPTKRLGRLNSDLRKVFNAIMYVQITGCRWCDVSIGEQRTARQDGVYFDKSLASGGLLCVDAEKMP